MRLPDAADCATFSHLLPLEDGNEVVLQPLSVRGVSEGRFALPCR